MSKTAGVRGPTDCAGFLPLPEDGHIVFAEGLASHTAGDVGDGCKFRAGGRVDREPQTAFDGNWEALLGLRRRSPANMAIA